MIRSVVVVAVLFAVFNVAPCLGGEFAAGIIGGSLALGPDAVFAIPDTFTIMDVQRSNAGIFVIAKREFDGPMSGKIMSELWLLPHLASGESAPAFAERRVLLSYNSRGGEGTHILKRIVSCPRATAVEIQDWESSTLALFDDTGGQIELPMKEIATACHCEPSYKRPVTWIMIGPGVPEHWELICEVGEEGGMWTYLMRYNLDTNQLTVQRATDAIGDVGDAILRYSN